ncbi:MAG: hypothetical protein K2Q01_03275, partial [Rickettsiales bacterium]|nr:hypothetical protein [Rickettsiales bacterium]
MHCRTIPQELPFLKTFAAWILSEYGQNPAELTRLLILLPNRRSCRSLREAFLECNNGTPVLLPRMFPLGEVDEEMTLLDESAATADIPAAISPLKRELMLTRVIRHFKTVQGQPFS